MRDTTIENDEIRAAVKSGDWETFHRLETERRAARKAAIERGIAASTNPGVYDYDPPPAERAAVETLAGRLANSLEEAEIGEAAVLKVCEDWAGRMAESPIRAKLELAYNLEADLTDGMDTPGGLLDRMLDEVIATLLPYAERASGWYKTTVG